MSNITLQKLDTIPRIGLFGGTFDPIHNGHLALINFAICKLNLNKILIIPSGIPPHKNQPMARYSERLQMINLALVGHFGEQLIISELDKPQENKKLNWTFALLKKLREGYPTENLIWLMGMDSYKALPLWKNWQEVIALCNFAVFNRNEQKNEQSLSEIQLKIEGQIKNILFQITDKQLPKYDYPFGEFDFVDFPNIDIAGSDIREMFIDKHFDEARKLLPISVYNFIINQNLYII